MIVALVDSSQPVQLVSRGFVGQLCTECVRWTEDIWLKMQPRYVKKLSDWYIGKFCGTYYAMGLACCTELLSRSNPTQPPPDWCEPKGVEREIGATERQVRWHSGMIWKTKVKLGFPVPTRTPGFSPVQGVHSWNMSVTWKNGTIHNSGFDIGELVIVQSTSCNMYFVHSWL